MGAFGGKKNGGHHRLGLLRAGLSTRKQAEAFFGWTGVVP